MRMANTIKYNPYFSISQGGEATKQIQTVLHFHNDLAVVVQIREIITFARLLRSRFPGVSECILHIFSEFRQNSIDIDAKNNVNNESREVRCELHGMQAAVRALHLPGVSVTRDRRGRSMASNLKAVLLRVHGNTGWLRHMGPLAQMGPGRSCYIFYLPAG